MLHGTEGESEVVVARGVSERAAICKIKIKGKKPIQSEESDVAARIISILIRFLCIRWSD